MNSEANRDAIHGVLVIPYHCELAIEDIAEKCGITLRIEHGDYQFTAVVDQRPQSYFGYLSSIESPTREQLDQFGDELKTLGNVSLSY